MNGKEPAALDVTARNDDRIARVPVADVVLDNHDGTVLLKPLLRQVEFVDITPANASWAC
jgi:hypothetical protein